MASVLITIGAVAVIYFLTLGVITHFDKSEAVAILEDPDDD